MDGQIEKSPDCYNFPKIRDVWKKYKLHATKRQQHDHHRRYKNHISSNNKVKPNDDLKTNPHEFEDDIFMATIDKQQDANSLHSFDKVSQNETRVEEINKMSHKQSRNYHNRHHNCFKTLILQSVPKKKKVLTRVSSFDLPQNQSTKQDLERDLPKSRSFQPTSSIGRSRSISTNGNNQRTRTPDTLRGLSINRTTSTGSRTTSFNRRNESFNRTGSVGRSASDVAARARLENISKSGPMIMFSNSSGMLKPPATEKQLECTLEELYHGCVKHVKASRDVYTFTGHISQEEEVFTVNIKPGWKTGTKITFQGTVNDERPEAYPGDIIFVIYEKHHPLFRRIDDDLELEVEVPLVDALTGCNIFIPSLGTEKMSMEIDDIIYSGYEKVFVGQGMPNQKNPHHKGNLILKFIVAFPNNLTDEQRSEIFRILSD